MPDKSKIRALFISLFYLSGCILGGRPEPLSTLVPSPTPEAGWQQLRPGLELRTLAVPRNPLGHVQVLRIDPAQFVFRAHYRPGAALTLNQWQEMLPGAVAFINANFFDPQHEILGLLITDSVLYGQSYQGMGGRFVVRGGQARILSNIFEPYAGESLEQAVEAFPMLVYNGQTAYQPSRQERATRRTVVAQDAQGRIFLMATPLLGLSLETLSAFLPSTELGLVDALNLDGGGSTMMYIDAPDNPLRLPSLDPVPAVLAVYPR
jgi:hypothetical protein